MSTLVDFALPVLFVVVVWWTSTGAIFYLNGRGEDHYRWNLLGAGALAVLAGYLLLVTRNDPGPAEAATAFVAAVAIWGLIEISFLTGFVTGPRRAPCPPDCSGGQRFRYACLAIAYHEAAIVISLGLMCLITAGSTNFVGAASFGLLWLMRLSTKLNIFFGVPNTAMELLPERIGYLKSYFRQGPMSALFPVSVSAATVLPIVFVMSASTASATSFEVTSYTLLAALSALGVIEHWFLVLPLPAQSLWGWSMPPGSTTMSVGERVPVEKVLSEKLVGGGKSRDR